MRRRHTLLGLGGAALLLAGCKPALDDPDNVPRLGRWRDETVPIGISIDDRGVPDGELPSDFRDLLAKLDAVAGRVLGA